MVILELRITMPQGREEAIRREVHRLLGPTRARQGCLDCRCFHETESESRLLLMEQWESQAHLDRHLLSEDFRVILGLMDLSAETPKFRIYTVSQSAGLDDLTRVWADDRPGF